MLEPTREAAPLGASKARRAGREPLYSPAMSRTSVAFTLLALSIGGASVAAAQEPTASPPPPLPPPTPLAGPVVAPGKTSDTAVPPPDALSLPLRLSLLSSLSPVGRPSGPTGCGAASVEAAGTIFSTQRYTQLQLTPRLVLHGFSDLGCPGDPYAAVGAGAGGGATYLMPLPQGRWLVASAGTYVVPSHAGSTGRTVAAGGLDLVVPTRDSGTLSTGLGVTGAGHSTRLMVRGGGTF